jgi:hypothetical protein
MLRGRGTLLELVRHRGNRRPAWRRRHGSPAAPAAQPSANLPTCRPAVAASAVPPGAPLAEATRMIRKNPSVTEVFCANYSHRPEPEELVPITEGSGCNSLLSNRAGLPGGPHMVRPACRLPYSNNNAPTDRQGHCFRTQSNFSTRNLPSGRLPEFQPGYGRGC